MIGQALSLGQTSITSELTRFHQPYRLEVARPPVDYVEVVTPFRRIVLAAQTRQRAGDRRFGQREALEVEAAAPRQIDLYAELTFHPLNTFVLVPAYRVYVLTPSNEILLPRNSSNMARYGPRVEGAPSPTMPTPVPGGATRGRSQPMLGATLVMSFDAELLAGKCAQRCDVVIEEAGKSRVQVALSLASLK